ncbi:MAG: S8 family serine peptidase [Leptolyngbya sp. SIO3F4]|nr:S8 family serine peptidase [Leptolyngbya sp. SIO3F4]
MLSKEISVKKKLPIPPSGNWGVDILNIPELWNYGKGEGVKIAVLDTGIDKNHKDLKDCIEETKDFTKSEVGVDDLNGHGTHIAGIIACPKHNIGVAPASKLYIGKVISDTGISKEEVLAKGIYWALHQKVDLICISLFTNTDDILLKEAIDKAALQNCTVVCAAGNRGPWKNTVGFPAKYKSTIAVGAVDKKFKLRVTSSQGEEVDIVAPGDNIRSTEAATGWYCNKGGTSMAAAFVAGVIALKKSKQIQYGQESFSCTSAKLKEKLLMTATGLGHHSLFGHGLINPTNFLFFQT